MAPATTDRPNRLWGIHDVATYCDVPVQTVYRWRKLRTGPPAMKVGKHLRWKPADVDRWLESTKADVR